ncbi:hypothetical protein [Terrabacter sp. NPDC000476]|uniref:hypothetical protein n=1 Tax=Terrabacter sp. NPDC000476 TaxID=3154258 RepID=UPI00331969EB
MFVSSVPWDDVLESLVLGSYSLLLGAGASMGSTNAAGERLLSGDGLRLKLAKVYGLPEEISSLREMYDYAQRAYEDNSASDNPQNLVQSLYQDCSVPHWYADLVRVPWRTIWNLNIDDVVVNAYQKTFDGLAAQDLHVSSWRDAWTVHRQPFEHVQMVHLHGRAAKGDLVFGTLEYLNAVRDAGASHHVFMDEWADGKPFIVVGAGLVDEFDIALPLMSRRPSSTGAPSLVVKPSFNDVEKFRFEKAGLIPVAMSAESFFEEVQERWEDALHAIPSDAVEVSKGISPNDLLFLKTFITPSYRVDKEHDFFSGDEPAWGDIRENLDFPRTAAPTSDGELFSFKGVRVYLFHGDLSGTTTAELRFLQKCIDSGYEVLEYVSDSAFSPAAIQAVALGGMRKILRIPYLEEYPGALKTLAEVAKSSGTPIVISTAMRTARVPGVSWPECDLVTTHIKDRLDPEEIKGMLKTLEVHARLNTLVDRNAKGRYDFVAKEHRGDMLDALSAISRGAAFEYRYESSLRSVAAEEKQVLDLALLAAELGHSLKFAICARALGMPVNDVKRIVAGESLTRVLTSAGDKFSARHRGLASRVSRRMLQPEDRFQSALSLATALSPYIHPTAIAARTEEARLCGRLMDSARVVDSLGVDRAVGFYDELHDHYEWNARYWEQRALTELAAWPPRFGSAESWARLAVHKHADAFSLNTLATVLLRQSCAGEVLDEALFFEGMQTVDAARAASIDRVTEHPYVTAFTYLTRAQKLSPQSGSLARRVDSLFNYWNRDARESRAWGFMQFRKDLESKIAEYMKVPRS